MQRFIFISSTLTFLTLILLTLATDSRSILSPYFEPIAYCAAALISVMLFKILRYGLMVWRDKKNHVFGAQITRRLALMFTLVTVLPGLLLTTIAYRFLSGNIQSWFGEETKQMFARSLELNKTALDNALASGLQQALVVRANLFALAVQQTSPQPALQTRQAKQFSQLIVWDLKNKKIIAQYNPHNFNRPLPPKDATFQTAILKHGRVGIGLEHYNNSLYGRGWLNLTNVGDNPQVLFFRYPVPERTARDAQLIEAANSKYNTAFKFKSNMRNFFIIALVLSALLSILIALIIALHFSRRLVSPIFHLAISARAVSQGNFERRINTTRNDELGKLANLFNHMTEQLAIAKQADESHRQQIEAAHHYLERVLDSISAGVITLDAAGSLKTFNRSAELLLDISLGDMVGEHCGQWTARSPRHGILAETFAAFLATERSGEAVEVAYTGSDEIRILLGKAVRLPEENGSGIVLVFDNITTLVLAQKEAAWGEVAKRLAHEIRNPLTPIQLSAERLAWKLSGKLSESDEKTLTKSTDTIIKQVAALKEMVEAFRNYARAPSFKMHTINLNELAAEVLVLYESGTCTFRAEFSKMPMLLKADTTALRQVLHNLLKNAAEAAAEDSQPEVSLHTTADNGQIILTVCNNGKSFSKAMLQNAFEPYVTDKATGTGLGLSVVKKIVEEHHGKIALSNRENGGACVTLTFEQDTAA